MNKQFDEMKNEFNSRTTSFITKMN